MNDSKEILHACEVLQHLLSKVRNNFTGEERVFVEQCADWFDTFRVTAYHLFVFSLSEERSLLSQWRSYTPHGKGVSIGFAAPVLSDILRVPGFKLARCLYETREHSELMESLLDKLLITFRRRAKKLGTSKSHQSQKYHPLLEEFRGDVLQVLAIVKHSAFREEREWRIVSPYFPKYTVPEIQFREGASMLLPYIELALPAHENATLFTEVILGPSKDTSLSFSALSAWLSNQRVCNVTVDSGIPFRKWHAI